jgi:hypothetical protein
MERNGAPAILERPAAAPAAEPTEEPVEEPVLDPRPIRVQADRPQPGKLRNRVSLMWALGIGLAIIVAAVVVGSLHRRPAVLTEKDTVVLADFTNSTGDPVFDDPDPQTSQVRIRKVVVKEIPDANLRGQRGSRDSAAK